MFRIHLSSYDAPANTSGTLDDITFRNINLPGNCLSSDTKDDDWFMRVESFCATDATTGPYLIMASSLPNVNGFTTDAIRNGTVPLLLTHGPYLSTVTTNDVGTGLVGGPMAALGNGLRIVRANLQGGVFDPANTTVHWNLILAVYSRPKKKKVSS